MGDGNPVHASAVAIDGAGILITGVSGSGKSDLALRLIDRGAMLIGDDGVILNREKDTIILTAPTTIAGQMEIRNLGIMDFLHISAPLKLIVDLDIEAQRYPDPPMTREMNGQSFPVLALDAFQSSAPIKVELALSAQIRQGNNNG